MGILDTLYPREWTENAFTSILIEKLTPNILNGIKIHEKLLGAVQKIYIDHFSKYKVRITQKMVGDITSKKR